MDRQQLAWLFFRLKGRLARAPYFLAGILLFVIQGFFLYRFTLEPEGSVASELLALVFWAAVVVSIWCHVALGVKRLHDIDRPGVWAVALFLPVVSFIAFIFLCLAPGNPGPNQYGAATNRPG